MQTHVEACYTSIPTLPQHRIAPNNNQFPSIIETIFTERFAYLVNEYLKVVQHRVNLPSPSASSRLTEERRVIEGNQSLGVQKAMRNAVVVVVGYGADGGGGGGCSGGGVGGSGGARGGGRAQ